MYAQLVLLISGLVFGRLDGDITKLVNTIGSTFTQLDLRSLLSLQILKTGGYFIHKEYNVFHLSNLGFWNKDFLFSEEAQLHHLRQ